MSTAGRWCGTARSPTFDIAEDIEMLRRGQRDVIANASSRDWSGRSLEQLSPRVFPVRA